MFWAGVAFGFGLGLGLVLFGVAGLIKWALG
jgi:hypothetical protein